MRGATRQLLVKKYLMLGLGPGLGLGALFPYPELPKLHPLSQTAPPSCETSSAHLAKLLPKVGPYIIYYILYMTAEINDAHKSSC